jgi:amidophosphoribosyltransferase
MLKYIKKEKLEVNFASSLNAIDQDTDNTVFSYIPNTKPLCGLVRSKDFLNQKNNFEKAITESLQENY